MLYSIPACLSVCHAGLDHHAVLRRFGRTVAAADDDLDVAEAALREMRLQLRDGLVLGHVGNQAEVELGFGAAGQDGLAARSRVAADAAPGC